MPFATHPAPCSPSSILLLAARLPAGRAGRRASARPAPALIAEQRQIIDGADEADRRAREARSQANREDDARLVEIRLQLEDIDGEVI